ncbi:MAG: CcmD family protein [Bacteroidetes bacterium]|nr:CcmD family protein [Bacteroidota bacterium]
MKKILLNILFLSLMFTAKAQAPAEESIMRSSGKIYVVVGIILIIFVLIAIYLFRLDRKISDLEDRNK